MLYIILLIFTIFYIKVIRNEIKKLTVENTQNTRKIKKDKDKETTSDSNNEKTCYKQRNCKEHDMNLDNCIENKYKCLQEIENKGVFIDDVGLIKKCRLQVGCMKHDNNKCTIGNKLFCNKPEIEYIESYESPGLVNIENTYDTEITTEATYPGEITDIGGVESIKRREFEISFKENLLQNINKPVENVRVIINGIYPGSIKVDFTVSIKSQNTGQLVEIVEQIKSEKMVVKINNVYFKPEIDNEKISDILVKKTKEISGVVGETIKNLEKLISIQSKIVSLVSPLTIKANEKIVKKIQDETIAMVEAEINIDEITSVIEDPVILEDIKNDKIKRKNIVTEIVPNIEQIITTVKIINCSAGLCQNGARCNDDFISSKNQEIDDNSDEYKIYMCICEQGYTGTNCETEISNDTDNINCPSQPCGENARCITENGYSCECLAGYSGNNCKPLNCPTGTSGKVPGTSGTGGDSGCHVNQGYTGIVKAFPYYYTSTVESAVGGRGGGGRGGGEEEDNESIVMSYHQDKTKDSTQGINQSNNLNKIFQD